ncbi:hypothetical protein, partial [Arthrobacter sp. H14]|uniref:hypothetical protein n=1 Tax=Arthrobacter sp. H14 TaxID=1312959 RepID=UPI0006841394
GAAGQASQQQAAQPDPKPTPASNDESSNDESSAKDGDGAAAGTDDDSAAGQDDNAAKDTDDSKAQEGDDATNDATNDDAEDAAASGSSSEAGADSTCDESSIAVSASTDKTVYTPEEKPVLTLTVSNEGQTECSVNQGTSEMEFLITSGEDRIFSSADCQVDSTDNYQTLEAGQSEKANFIWDRSRTAPGCDAVDANPMPGTYILVTKLGEWTSEETIFKLN